MNHFIHSVAKKKWKMKMDVNAIKWMATYWVLQHFVASLCGIMLDSTACFGNVELTFVVSGFYGFDGSVMQLGGEQRHNENLCELMCDSNLILNNIFRSNGSFLKKAISILLQLTQRKIQDLINTCHSNILLLPRPQSILIIEGWHSSP